MRLFTTGAAPADVQVWQPPCEQADVLLFPSHADDDVIFFGALAAQCVDRGLAVQVAYLVNHYDWQPRPQELLDALWTMGIRNYPVIGPFPDYYVLSLEAAQQSFGERGLTEVAGGAEKENAPSGHEVFKAFRDGGFNGDLRLVSSSVKHNGMVLSRIAPLYTLKRKCKSYRSMRKQTKRRRSVHFFLTG